MAIKLSELYKSTNRKDMKLIAGKNGINNIVSWAHMIESIETSIFLEGEELAFTTGIALEKNEDLYELVEHTYTHHASGIVINTGPYIEKIPEEVIQFCDEHDFPLFEVPWHMYMSNILKDFCYQITITDRANLELSGALKNAIFFPDQHEFYIPHLESNNFNANWSYCTAVIEAVEKDGLTVVDSKKREIILKSIKKIITSSYKRSFAFELDEKFILVFAKYSQEKIKSISEIIKNKCVDILNSSQQIYFCIGENTKNIEGIAKSYRQAMDALKLQKRKEISNEISMYRELGAYKLLLAIDDKELLEEYYHETIEELIQTDELKGSDLVAVLDSYLKNSGSIKAVSEELFYHKNTVCYKLAKIEEIIGCNLSYMNVRLKYSLALMLREII